MKLDAFRDACSCFRERARRLRTAFFTLCVLYALTFSSVIRANVYYLDDMGRTAQGYQGWENFSRFLSNYLSSFIHTNSYLADISPLTQFIAVIFLASASVIVIYVFADAKKISPWTIAAVMPLGISPYFLGCVSYKYDAPYMALAILSMLVPFLFYRKSLLLYSVASICGTLAMCTTYQAASGIYPVMCVFVALKMWNQGEDAVHVLKYIGCSALSYCVGILVFQRLIMVPAYSYVGTNIFPLSELVGGFAKNLAAYYALFLSDFRVLWLVLAAVIVIGYIPLSVMSAKRGKFLALIFAVSALFCAALLSFGLYPALQTPSADARAMYGIGVTLAIIMVQCANFDKTYLIRAACVMLSWCFVSFSFAYGNALSEQQRYVDYRIGLLASDLNELEVMRSDTMKTLQLTGSAGQSPVLLSMPESYHMICDRLVQTTLAGDWMWNEKYFRQFFDIKNICEDSGVDLTEMELPILKDTMYHTIRGNEQYILIELK